ncbi:MAG: sigma 54-interacting transcriptional regulator [Anaeromicrobium sp.]|uniref:sigma-54 interaction domain-containing protein n=1 Tax=Anaeromicrobium sp. TaxID=1929132 RepID=UPI0025FC1D58|nr:sigma 54-interacting transcriptional regulator [Anaeromicrobium sp.]MCT4594170.1 sigma 54-interacting transcriptional regulator [Anaeromicrobium sp.]
MLNRDFIRQFAHVISEGFIFIDSKGTIELYNDKAKSIFGILNNSSISHDSGKIEKGDIVIIVDNSLGKDDGYLSRKDLGKIGIKDEKITSGSAFIGIGKYEENDSQYIYEKNRENLEVLNLKEEFHGLDIECEIDFLDKYVNIIVNKMEFKLSYIYAIGHMVVIDPISHKVKFCQNRGYTAKGESVKELLDGKKFLGKGKNQQSFSVIGKNIYDVHESPLIDKFYKVAQGEKITYKNKSIEINGIPTRCSIYPIDYENKPSGAALKVEDTSLIKKIMKERDEAIDNLERMERVLYKTKDMYDNFSHIIGHSKKMNHVKRLIHRGSQTNSTVLLLGESGTGKSLLAKLIHKNGNRKSKPFIHVNCASIPEQLLESELFGYESGAFTGANREGKKGYFQLAEDGTIFLDEIGEMPKVMQSKLLKALQERTFYRVGGTVELEIKARIICATNKVLEEEIKKGTFREDLYYRINVFPIYIPPLRERKEDINELVKGMLPNICGRLNVNVKKLSSKAMYDLAEYDWPGNIRELENVLERAVNVTEGSIIHEYNLFLRNNKNNNEKEFVVKTLKDHMNEAEKHILVETIKVCKGDKKKAMEALNIKKTSFYDKLKKYNI